MFCIVVEAEPTPGSPQAHDIKAGVVHVWVDSASAEEARTMVLAHLMDYAWIAKSVRHLLEPTPEQIARLDEVEGALHRRALRDGLASMFIAWPKVDGTDADPVELRSLGEPPEQSEEKH